MTPPAARPPSRPGLWRFSTAVYGRPGVKEACLALQEAGLDVNVALWIVWTAITGRDPGPALAQAIEMSALWRARVVQPLREARDALKPAPDFMPQEAAQSLRGQILAAELNGERMQQEALAALSPACPGHDGADVKAHCAVRLADYARACGPHAPAAEFIETVFSALETV